MPEGLADAHAKLAAGRSYQREHFPLGHPGKFVGHVPSEEYDAALDLVIEWLGTYLSRDDILRVPRDRLGGSIGPDLTALQHHGEGAA